MLILWGDRRGVAARLWGVNAYKCHSREDFSVASRGGRPRIPFCDKRELMATLMAV